MSGSDKKDVWLEETLHPDIRFAFRVGEVLHEDKSDAWHLQLVTNPLFGKVLMLDGVTQVTTADEFVYHEMLAHVPLFAHGLGSAKDVLIIGGGDCGLAEEVLKHPYVERLTQVEIDPAVLEFSRTHFAEMNAPVFDDPRFDSVIADGAKFVAETDKRFDVVMVDSTDPIGPGAVLFEESFYRNCHRVLKSGGILVTQNGVPFLQKDELVGSIAKFSRIFADCGAYTAVVPTYIGGHMALGFACDDPAKRFPVITDLDHRFDEAGITTRYYTPEVHLGAFALPRFIADAVAEGRAQG